MHYKVLAKCLLVSTFLFSLTLPAIASDPVLSESDAIALAQDRGKRIYAYDQAAWHATDQFLKDKDSIAGLQPKGFIVTEAPEEKSGSLRVTFVDGSTSPPTSAADYIVRKRKVRSRQLHEQRRTLSDEELRRLGAQGNMVKYLIDNKLDLCRQFLPMNSIVLPEDSGYRAYLFSASKQAEMVVLGRHYAFDLDAKAQVDGAPTVSTNSCFAVTKSAPEGGTSVALTASHITSPFPGEHHVFASLTHGLPIYVVIPGEDGAEPAFYNVDGKRMKRTKMSR